MSEAPKNTGISKWVYIVIASVAINGLLVGLLLSKNIGSGPIPGTRAHHKMAADGFPDDSRRMVRHLSQERRREIMRAAYENLDIDKKHRPRELFAERRKARERSLKIAGTDPLDIEALRKSLEDVRSLNEKLATQGDLLIVEVLQLMTPQERESAMKAVMRKKRDRSQRREGRPSKHERD